MRIHWRCIGVKTLKYALTSINEVSIMCVGVASKFKTAAPAKLGGAPA